MIRFDLITKKRHAYSFGGKSGKWAIFKLNFDGKIFTFSICQNAIWFWCCWWNGFNVHHRFQS